MTTPPLESTELKKAQSVGNKFIFFTILLDAMGIGLIIPVLPEVLRRFNADPSFVNQYYGWFIASYALLQFLASPILGALSDRYGRRPVLLASLLGAGIDYLIMAFTGSFAVLFLGRIVSGLTGAGQTVASAYMADISDDSNRSANFGLIGAAFGIGFIFGPALGGILGKWGPMAPFVAAAVLNLLNFFFGFFILPESLPPEKRRKLELKKMNPIASLKGVLGPHVPLLFVAVYFLAYLAGQSHPAVWTLFTEHKFNWNSFDVGLSLSLVGVFVAIGQGFLTRIIIPKIGEEKAVIYGILFNFVAYFLYAIATQGWMMYAIIPLMALAGLEGPALQSIISKNTPSEEQGELQGTLIALASLTSVIGPLIFVWLFDRFTAKATGAEFAGAPYMFAALITLLSLFMVMKSIQQKSPQG